MKEQPTRRAGFLKSIFAIASARATGIILRSIHVVTMGPLLGGIALGATRDTLRMWIALTIASGLLLLAGELLARRITPTQGSGVALLVKLALLAVGNAIPAQRLPWYLAGTFIACLAAHMPKAWRHFSFVVWRVTSRSTEAQT